MISECKFAFWKCQYI